TLTHSTHLQRVTIDALVQPMAALACGQLPLPSGDHPCSGLHANSDRTCGCPWPKAVALASGSPSRERLPFVARPPLQMPGHGQSPVPATLATCDRPCKGHGHIRLALHVA
ncbi:hypothetical protein BHM03_00060768, partial [Ensete ventricosum]